MSNNLWILMRLFIFIGIFSLHIPSAFASSKEKVVREGNELYSKELYDKAAEKYNDALSKDSESDIINFNLGTALYKQGDYLKSIGHLQKALLSDDNELKKNAYFNLGNSFYKEGMSKEKNDLKYAIQSLESSIAQYEKIINIDKDNKDNKNYKDAKFNYDYVSKELKKLKLKLEQQQQQQQQQDQSKKNKGSEEKGNKAEQSKQDQNKESQSQGQQEQYSEKKQSETEQAEGNKEEKKKAKEEKDSQDQGSRQQSSSGKKEEKQGNKEKQNIDQGNTGEMTKEEAEMILRKYQQTEEPEGLLKFNKHYSEPQGVVKDW